MKKTQKPSVGLDADLRKQAIVARRRFYHGIKTIDGLVQSNDSPDALAAQLQPIIDAADRLQDPEC